MRTPSNLPKTPTAPPKGPLGRGVRGAQVSAHGGQSLHAEICVLTLGRHAPTQGPQGPPKDPQDHPRDPKDPPRTPPRTPLDPSDNPCDQNAPSYDPQGFQSFLPYRPGTLHTMTSSFTICQNFGSSWVRLRSSECICTLCCTSWGSLVRHGPFL
jgi:hypothetical protein